MFMGLERDHPIEDLRGHSAETLAALQKLLASEARVSPDPKRPGFYEVESDSLTYYIHVSPASGKILLLATWPNEGTRPAASQAA